jgi:butyryl-CoA dehydrogenase
MIPTNKHIEVRNLARNFARDRLVPLAPKWDRENRYPAEAIREMAKLGFFGMLTPKEWGGSDVAKSPTAWPWKRSPLATALAQRS